MTRFQVDSIEVQQASQTTRATIDRIQADVGSLMGQLNALQGSWTGQAATAFQAAVSDWRGLHQQVEQQLARLHGALGMAATQYLEAEQANARLFMR
ncbi:WXG100 family type VII secretion target [Agromyces archimandritae]|uniref:ESAT-6-like protein n=1 Tax=Agromyces archimandritae TaxID=2781962 RepID=A0A975IMZ2_9MICO|nr:WXG100 family type VII secretion target [Agromyces archimandritae]QTX03995.1 WXG100 family type VII secretion target [Agromyces archimandritae]